MGIQEELEYNFNYYKEIQKHIKLHSDAVKKIKRSLATKQIKYPEYQEAYDYVDALFPDAEVKDVTIYQVSPRYLTKLGYHGVGGFFEKTTKSIVISSRNSLLNKSKYVVQGKMDRDDVIVHELIHYADNTHGFNNDRSLAEEFAYGWSLGYLRNKGYTDEEIVQNNYLPYLNSLYNIDGFRSILLEDGVGLMEFDTFSDKKKQRFVDRLGKRIFERTKKIATEKGMEIIAIYETKISEGKTFHREKRIKAKFASLDLD